MRKGVMSLEEMQEDQRESLPTVPAEVLALTEAAHEGEVQTGVIEETEQITDELVGIRQRLEKTKAEGGELSDSEAEHITASLEHYRKRLGFRNPKFPALEGYSSAGAGKQQKLNHAIESVEDTIISTAKAKFSLFCWIAEGVTKDASSREKTSNQLIAEIEAVSKEYDQSENHADGEVSGVWVSELTPKAGARELDGSAIVKNVEDYAKPIASGQYRSSVKAATDAIIDVVETIRSIWFFSNKNEISKLDGELSKIQSSVLALAGGRKEFAFGINETSKATLTPGDDAEVIVAIEKDKNPLSTGSLKTLGAAEKQKLVALVKSILGEHSVDKEMVALSKAIKSAYGYTVVNNTFRLADKLLSMLVPGSGIFYAPQDLRRAMSATTAAQGMRNFFAEEYMVRVKIAKAVIAYIKASSK